MRLILVFAFLAFALSSTGQDDLLDLLGEDEPTQDFATAGFKTTRIINGHSFELNSHGVLDFKISHRFGRLNTGAYNLFGLDNAFMRIGLDYGVTEWLNVGIGRSGGAIKYYDSFVKARILRQQTGMKNVPVSLLWVTDLNIDANQVIENSLLPYPFTNRMYYTNQIIVGRKFNDAISLQFMPSLVHRNFVRTKAESNDVIVLGVGGRVKLTRRVAINMEYHYVLPDQLDPKYSNSLSVGFDIETGGHVFQLHFTNSRGMAESVFLTETDGKWDAGDIHFGFNVSRVFTVHRPKRK